MADSYGIGSEATMVSVLDTIRTLSGRLWLILVVKVLAICAYALMNSTLVLYLSAELHFSDEQAAFTVATWSALMSLFTIFIGSLVDTIGLRRALLLGFFVCVCARAVMTACDTSVVVLTFGVLPLALGEALMTPVMVSAVKHFSKPEQRPFAFALFYAMMNVGFAMAGWLFDKIRSEFGEHSQLWMPVVNSALSTYQIIFLVSVGLTVIGLLCVVLGVHDSEKWSTNRVLWWRLSNKKEHRTTGRFSEAGSALLTIGNEAWERFWTTTRESQFRQFLLLLAVMVGVRMVLYHMYYTFPKFALRELGDGAPIGRLFGVLNALVVICVTPMIGLAARKSSTFKVLLMGSAISATSIFVLALPPAWFAGPAASPWWSWIMDHWFGIQSDPNPLYMTIIIAVIGLSFGETLWSPRLYEYTAAIAPKGRESTYMSLSVLPLFVAKFLAGGLSGWLLNRYCPELGPRDSQTLWFIIASMAAITPLGLILFRLRLVIGVAHCPGNKRLT